MKYEKYQQNIHVYLLKYLNEWDLNKEKKFQAFKSDLPTYQLHKVFAGLTDFLKLLVSRRNFVKLLVFSANFIKLVCKTHTFFVKFLANSINFVKLLANSTNFLKLFANFTVFVKYFPTSTNVSKLFVASKNFVKGWFLPSYFSRQIWQGDVFRKPVHNNHFMKWSLFSLFLYSDHLSTTTMF